MPWGFIAGSLVSLAIQVGYYTRNKLHPAVLSSLNSLMFLAWMVTLTTWGKSSYWVFRQFCYLDDQRYSYNGTCLESSLGLAQWTFMVLLE